MSYVALGRAYDVTLPVIGRTSIEVPVDQLVHDAIDAAKADIWARFRQNWYWYAGGALVVATAIIWRRS